LPDPLWVNPAEIVWKISPFLDLPPLKGGGWDIERRHRFQDCAKYRAVHAHFVDGVPWIETELFTEAYRSRLEREGRIGRHRSLTSVADGYSRFDKLYSGMKRDGFRTEAASGKQYVLPALLVGRDGEVFIGNQGNHRLAIAQVLGLDRFAGRIACRHELWTP
jgi:hypothetical protein